MKLRWGILEGIWAHLKFILMHFHIFYLVLQAGPESEHNSDSASVFDVTQAGEYHLNYGLYLLIWHSYKGDKALYMIINPVNYTRIKCKYEVRLPKNTEVK